VTLTADSPRWVGAWWIGFLISAGLAFLVALPIAGFPTALPGSEQYKAERGKEVYSKKGRKQDYQEASQDTENVLSYKQILKSVKVLVTNPTFMFLNLAGACEGKLVNKKLVCEH
jgi:organic anion transporter 4A